MSTENDPKPENPELDVPLVEAPPETDPRDARIADLEQQISNYKLILAEFENSRKRLLQDADRQRKYAAEPFARDLLTAFDNLERALQAAQQSGDEGPLAQGVAATLHAFLDALKRHSVNKVEVGPGSPFDPSVHEAVMEHPTNDYEPGQVVQVLQHGFQMHDRLLRPTTVIVAKEPPAGE
jgi:molecular chaperone GrpE